MGIASRIFSVMLSASVLSGTVSAAVFAEEYGDLEKYDKGGFSYQKVDENDDGKYDHIKIIEYYNEVADVVIPDEIDGVPVTVIGYGSFGRSSNLVSVTMGDNVEVIEDRAFMSNENLKTIKLSPNIKDVGRNVFKDTPWLDSIRAEKKPLIIKDMLVDGVGCEGKTEIPDTVTKIIPYAFQGAENITEVTMPDTVTWIGECAFEYCGGLAKIYLSDTLTSVEERTFNGCTSLKEADIPASVKYIGILAFSDCHSLEKAVIRNAGCEIPSSPYVFVGGYDEDDSPIFNGTIFGYKDSTAQSFADEMKYKFEPLSGEAPPTTTSASTSEGSTATTATTVTTVTTTDLPPLSEYIYGDVDLNGVVELADVTRLSKFLLNKKLYPLGNGDDESEKRAAVNSDVKPDDIVDSIDLSKLIEYNIGKLSISDLGR